MTSNQSTEMKVTRLIAANMHSMLTLCTLITISRTVTAVSLRLVAKLLCDLADRLEVNKSPTCARRSDDEIAASGDDVAGPPATIRLNSSSAVDTNISDLEERYNQLVEDTRASLISQAQISIKRTNINDVELIEDVSSMCFPLDHKERRPRTDSTDSGTADLDYMELDPDTGLEVVNLAEVGEHCSLDDAWMVIYDKVYDVTDYMSRHPGGEEVMMEYIGYDATIAFRGVAHSKAAFRALDKYCVGILPASERLNYSPL